MPLPVGLESLLALDGRAVAVDLRPVYRASTAEEAERRLEEFAAKWDGAYPTISQMWRRNWEHLTPFFAYPADIRRVIYTTNAVESLNMSLRKVIKTRGSFPTVSSEKNPDNQSASQSQHRPVRVNPRPKTPPPPQLDNHVPASPGLLPQTFYLRVSPALADA